MKKPAFSGLLGLLGTQWNSKMVMLGRRHQHPRSESNGNKSDVLPPNGRPLARSRVRSLLALPNYPLWDHEHPCELSLFWRLPRYEMIQRVRGTNQFTDALQTVE